MTHDHDRPRPAGCSTAPAPTAAHPSATAPCRTSRSTTCSQAVTDSGLTGRGGAGFPTAIKVRAVADGGRRPVVVGNAHGGRAAQPQGRRAARPATRTWCSTGSRSWPARCAPSGRSSPSGPSSTRAAARPPRAAARSRSSTSTGGFVAGQETALVNQLDGRPAVPRDPFTRVTESGVDGRPTLVLNAETLAQVALRRPARRRLVPLGRHRRRPRHVAVHVTGSVSSPGRGRGRARQPRCATCWRRPQPVRPAAVLVGGYHGAWVPASSLDVRLTRVGPRAVQRRRRRRASCTSSTTAPARSASPPRSSTTSPASRPASAGRASTACPGWPTTCTGSPPASATRGLPRRDRPDAALVTGRGACAHPDGSARFVASTLDVFRDHVAAHLEGWCPQPAPPRRPS